MAGMVLSHEYHSASVGGFRRLAPRQSGARLGVRFSENSLQP